MELIKLQWRRDSSDKLSLWVFEDHEWLPYKKAKYYTPDAPISTNNGFATAQKYIALSKENKIDLNYLPIKD